MDETLIETLQELMQKIAAVVREVVKRIADIITEIAAPLIKAYVNAVLSYADSKTLHLAKHGKNRRIRKKNRKKALQQGFAKLQRLNERRCAAESD